MVCAGRVVSHALALVAVLAGMAHGQSTAGTGTTTAPVDAIDRLPYKITAHLAIAPEARIDTRGREQLLGAWRGLVQRFIGAPWELSIAESDRAARGIDLEALEPDALDALAAAEDKVWLIQLGRAGAGWSLAGRELDTATRRLGPVCRQSAPIRADLPRGLLDLARALFRPSAAIGEPSGGGVALVLRAGALRVASSAGQFVKAGTVFRPIRKVTLPDGTEQRLDIPFTYLRVESLDGPGAHAMIISSLRDPLTRRIAQKSNLMALGSAPGPYPTRLRFLTMPDKAPAAGYLLTGRSLPDGLARDLGTTDRAGRIVLPPGQYGGLISVRLLAGGVEPLVEFPIMPGESEPERTLPPLDPHRATVALEAELDALRDAVIDLVAVRARLEARLKARYDGEDWAGAEAALQEFYRLPSRDSFAARLAEYKEDAAAEQAKTRSAVLTRTAQAQIAELDGLIARYLDDDIFRGYADALTKVRAEAARGTGRNVKPAPNLKSQTQKQ
jgi:hypothetical protein